MLNKISIRDIMDNRFDVRCLALISNDVPLAHSLDRTIINPWDKGVLPLVMDHALSNDDTKLHELYSNIRMKLHAYLSEESAALRIAADISPTSLSNLPVGRAAPFLIA